MPKDRNFREPDENSGPAVAGREPVLFPDKRKRLVRRARRRINEVRD